MIRIALVEDHTLVRQGLKALLENDPELEVVGEAEDGVAGLELISRVKPDVVLLDLRMPRLDGLGVLRALANDASAPALVVLTTFQEREDVREAIRLGARGYLLKDVRFEELTAALRKVLAGGMALQALPAEGDPEEEVLARLPPAEQPSEPLTQKERDVLWLMCGGLSNRDIGARLGVVEGTVKNHVSVILWKLGVRSRTQAVLRAMKEGLF